MGKGISSTDAPLSGEVLAEVTDAITRIKANYYGRGAPRGKSYLNDDILFCVLRGGLTDVEVTLLDRGRGDEVRRLRLVFQEEMRDEYVRTVERLTGRPVLDYFSQFLVESQMTIEMFVLNLAESNGV